MYTFDDNTYSDLHKDCYGFRPSVEAMIHWHSLTADQKQAEWDRLCVALEEEIAAEKRGEELRVARFEQLVVETVAAGAADRETAIQWLIDAEGLEQADVDYVEYSFGLPYGYLKNNR